MTRKELSEISARYAVAHRQSFEVIGAMLELAQLDKASKHSPEVLECLEAYNNTRTKLIEAWHWKNQLHQALMVRTEEGREAMKKYIAAMQEAQNKNSESPQGSPEDVLSDTSTSAGAEAVPESSEPPKLVLLPKVEGSDNG